jgi:cholesterol oxidase
MALLASSLDQVQAHYHVLIIGSGYGGGVAAARLGGAKTSDGSPLRVAVFERGFEVPLGEFPEDPIEGWKMHRRDAPGAVATGPDPLFNFHLDKEIMVIHAFGLGGTSLINANISLEPVPGVWQNPSWPQEIRGDVGGLRTKGFKLAREVLRPSPYPDSASHPSLAKYRALQLSGKATGNPVYHPPTNITYNAGPSAGGVVQPACNSCGDCVAGCNTGSKNTVTATYLPLAHSRGVAMFCGARVTRLERRGEVWLVWYQPTEYAREAFGAPELFVRADQVVLAAGTLGSTEILLRSAAAGLSLSPALGSRFSGNGNELAVAYNSDHPINGIGRGSDVLPENAPGPTITGILDARNEKPTLEHGIVVEEGVLPKVLHQAYNFALNLAGPTTGVDMDSGVLDELREARRTLTSGISGAYASGGATQHSQSFLVMAHDRGNGSIRLENDRVQIDWPDAHQSPHHARVDALLAEASKAIGGTYTRSPLKSGLLGNRLLTVHPLGGCPMGDDPATSVVDHAGRPWIGTSNTIHPGIMVADGSVLPCPLGVNPLLTITALAERSVLLLASERGWTLSSDAPASPNPFDSRRELGAPTRLWFTERMAGSVAPGQDLDYSMGAQHGQSAVAVFTIESTDIDRFLNDSAFGAGISGSVELRAFSQEPFVAHDGRFQLLVDQSPDGRRKRMFYRVPLQGPDGRRLYFHGHKQVEDGPGFDPWKDTTTLFVSIHEGDDQTGPVIGRGIISIHVDDFRKQALHTHARNGQGRPAPGQVARFAATFLEGLADVYAPMPTPAEMNGPAGHGPA